MTLTKHNRSGKYCKFNMPQYHVIAQIKTTEIQDNIPLHIQMKFCSISPISSPWEFRSVCVCARACVRAVFFQLSPFLPFALIKPDKRILKTKSLGRDDLQHNRRHNKMWVSDIKLIISVMFRNIFQLFIFRELK